MTLPAELTYGHVVARIILAVADGPDEGALPDAKVPADMRVTITPKAPVVRVAGDAPTTVVKQAITCTIDSEGNLIDPEGAVGVWLVTGTYAVSYRGSGTSLPNHDIVVEATHDADSPLDLTTAMPPGGPALTPSQYAELRARIDAIEVGAGPKGDQGDPGPEGPQGPAGPAYTPPDTGWRQVTIIDAEAFPTVDYSRVRRVGSTVWVTLFFSYTADAFSAMTSAMPSGFRPANAFSSPVSGYTGNPVQIGVFTVNAAGSTNLRINSEAGSAASGYFTTSWLTDQPWPSTLPGTPA